MVFAAGEVVGAGVAFEVVGAVGTVKGVGAGATVEVVGYVAPQKVVPIILAEIVAVDIAERRTGIEALGDRIAGGFIHEQRAVVLVDVARRVVLIAWIDRVLVLEVEPVLAGEEFRSVRQPLVGDRVGVRRVMRRHCISVGLPCSVAFGPCTADVIPDFGGEAFQDHGAQAPQGGKGAEIGARQRRGGSGDSFDFQLSGQGCVGRRARDLFQEVEERGSASRAVRAILQSRPGVALQATLELVVGRLWAKDEIGQGVDHVFQYVAFGFALRAARVLGLVPGGSEQRVLYPAQRRRVVALRFRQETEQDILDVEGIDNQRQAVAV
ncbi:MAG: hypothetical protein AW08_03929 [Candidatus Accumulibacter adjunctus]|uniref:Uncharacterized protein n=1 Tax=Candidatus Accumulibacter adjunctus TaxID=1454001 RepID=A0A011MME4_9PROT|nr:MAG: hypothetical protein AW08_03929 [Candidatus Accumulibacter adjunctus]